MSWLGGPAGSHAHYSQTISWRSPSCPETGRAAKAEPLRSRAFSTIAPRVHAVAQFFVSSHWRSAGASSISKYEAVRAVLGRRNPYERLMLVRFSIELSDLSGRGACGVCPGSPELKASGLSRTVSNSPIIRKSSEFRGGAPRQTLSPGDVDATPRQTMGRMCAHFR